MAALLLSERETRIHSITEDSRLTLVLPDLGDALANQFECDAGALCSVLAGMTYQVTNGSGHILVTLREDNILFECRVAASNARCLVDLQIFRSAVNSALPPHMRASVA